jgi:hypothetical protein
LSLSIVSIVCILHKIGTTIFHFCGTQKRDPKGVAGTLATQVRRFFEVINSDF